MVGVQASDLEISPDVSQKNKNRTAMWPSYITIGHIYQVFCVLLQKYLHIHVTQAQKVKFHKFFLVRGSYL